CSWVMLWPRKTSTRCSAQAALIARTAPSDSSLVRSTPLISAPQAADSGVTSISMTSCMGRSSANENASLAPSCRVSSNRLLSDVAASWMMLFSVSAASCARRPALPDQAIAVVEKEGLDLGLDLAQRGDDVLRLFASHEDGLGLDDVGIVADELGVLPQFDERRSHQRDGVRGRFRRHQRGAEHPDQRVARRAQHLIGKAGRPLAAF